MSPNGNGKFIFEKSRESFYYGIESLVVLIAVQFSKIILH